MGMYSSRGPPAATLMHHNAPPIPCTLCSDAIFEIMSFALRSGSSNSVVACLGRP